MNNAEIQTHEIKNRQIGWFKVMKNQRSDVFAINVALALHCELSYSLRVWYWLCRLLRI